MAQGAVIPNNEDAISERPLGKFEVRTLISKQLYSFIVTEQQLITQGANYIILKSMYALQICLIIIESRSAPLVRNFMAI